MSDQAPWEAYKPAANVNEPWKEFEDKPWEAYAGKEVVGPAATDAGMMSMEMGGVPQPFIDRLTKGMELNGALERVGAAIKQGAGEGLGTGQFGFEPGSQVEQELATLGIFNKPGELSPIRTMNEAMIRPLAAGFDAVTRLTHAGARGIAGGIAQVTAEAGGSQNVEKNKNELDKFAEIALILAGSNPISRPRMGPDGRVVDQKIGSLPKPQDFPDAATVLSDGIIPPRVAGPVSMTMEVNGETVLRPGFRGTVVEEKAQRLWQEKGIHPAEVVLDAETNPVLKQQMLSRTPDLPEEYAGLTKFGMNTDWGKWDKGIESGRIASRELKNGEIVPAPEAVATYLQQFGQEAGFKFVVGPVSKDKFQDGNQPHFIQRDYQFPDGRWEARAQVYIPDNPDALFRQWYGLGKNEVLYHEVGHALDSLLVHGGARLTKLEDIKAVPGLVDEMRAANQAFAPKLWEMNPEYRELGRELVADSIAAWLSNPNLRKEMPIFTREYGPLLEKYKDIAERALPQKTDGINWDLPPGDKGFQGGGPGGRVPGGDGGGTGGGPPPLQLPGPPPDPASLAAARQKVLSRLSINESRAGTPETSFSRFYSAVVDRFYPVDTARKGIELTAENDPYKLARLYAGWTGKADHMLNQGTYDFHTYKNNGPGLKTILDPVKADLDGFRAFAAAARAAELDKRGLAHGFDMDAVRMVGVDGIKTYGPVMKQLVEYQNNVSKYLKDSGVLSDVAYEAMLESNKLFVPFHRVMGDEATFGGRLGGANLTARNPIKTLEGSTREVIDPLESVIKNTYLLTSMAEKNTVGTKLIDMLIRQRAHEAIDGRAPEMSNLPAVIDAAETRAVGKWLGNNGGAKAVADDLATVLADAATPSKPGELSIFRNGTRFTYAVDAELANAMKGLDAASIGLVERLMEPMASTLRAGAILNPEFAARHTFRDFLYAFVKTPDGLYSPADAARGLVGLITKDKDYWEWMKGGGSGSTLVSLDRRYLQESLDKLNGDTGLFTRSWNVVIDPSATWLQKGGAVAGLPFSAIGKYVVHPLQLTAELAMNMNHLGGFKRALRNSTADASKADILEAGWISRNTGVDNGRIGSKTQGYNMISAFFNAKVQDTTQVMEAMAKNPVSTGMRVAIGITIPSLMLWAYNKDDSRYKELPEWEKDVFWIIPTDSWEKATPEEAANRPSDQVRVQGGETFVNNGTLWRLPKPFSLGVMFGSGAERLADHFYQQNPDAFKGFFKSLRESTVGDLTPNAITPMLEQSANRTQYTGRTLIPATLEKGLPEYQYAPYTTELAKKLGQVVAAFPGMREASVGHPGEYDNAVARALSSPILIENYVRGWTGGLGIYALKALDKVGRLTGALEDPVHAESTLADIPIVKAFVARYPSANSQSITEFYEGYGRNQTYYASYMLKAKEGDVAAMNMIQAAGGDEMFSKLDAIKKTIGDHYTMIRSIDALPETEMKPYEKRQLIDGLYFSMIRVGQQGNEFLKEIKAKQD